MRSLILPMTVLLFAIGAPVPAHAQVDADAAQALAKRNNCFKCHSIEKAKMAPAYKRIAAAMSGKPDAVDRIVKHITTGPTVKLEDGTEEKHKIIDTDDPKELANIARWILSL